MITRRYNTINISKLLDDLDRFTVGLDPWFTNLAHSHSTSYGNYPPINIVNLGEGKTRIEVAVAGFTKDDIKVYQEDSVLTISGEKSNKDTESCYHYNGIAKRSFKRSWTLGEDTVVDEVELKDGLLSVNLRTLTPEPPKRTNYTIR